MNEGRVQQIGSGSELYDSPRTRSSRRSSARRRSTCSSARLSDGDGGLAIAIDGQRLPVPPEQLATVGVVDGPRRADGDPAGASQPRRPAVRAANPDRDASGSSSISARSCSFISTSPAARSSRGSPSRPPCGPVRRGGSESTSGRRTSSTPRAISLGSPLRRRPEPPGAHLRGRRHRVASWSARSSRAAAIRGPRPRQTRDADPDGVSGCSTNGRRT